VGKAGGSVSAEHSTEAVLSGGDLDSCPDDTGRCGAPIRLRLMPVTSGAPSARIAPVAEQGLRRPKAKLEPAKNKLMEGEEQAFRDALLQTLHLGAESCVAEYPPESWGEQGTAVLEFSIEFGPNGVPTAVDVTVPEGMPPIDDAARCAAEFGWSARYLVTGSTERLDFTDIAIYEDR
jgi:hypothetical protein